MLDSIILPPYLKAGDTIGLVCPAGQMNFDKIVACIEVLNDWGYDVKLGKTIGSKPCYFSGSDAERLNDVQTMLDDPNLQAVLCARGGYGTSRILDNINWAAFNKNPKWIIGFSDITALHSHLYNTQHTASIHGPMANAFNDALQDNTYIYALKNAVEGKPLAYNVPSHSANILGSATGILVGGNLSLLAHIIGSKSDVDYTNKILFIEDVGEQYYSIDRMLVQLYRSGKLHNLAGLIVGGFSQMQDTTISFGKTIEEIILEKVQDFGYPVCFNFPISHELENLTVKVGVNCTLIVGDTVSFSQK